MDYVFDVRDHSNNRVFNILENGNVGIGVIATSSTARLSVRGNVDFYFNSTTAPNLRIVNSSGTVRHVITDLANNLVLSPGVGGGANNRVAVNGELSISEKTIPQSGIDMTETDPGSNGWYNQIAFKDGTGSAQQVLCNAGTDLILNLNPFSEGSGKLKIAGNVVIGNVAAPCTTGSCYSLYVEKGILAERFKCALNSDNVNWSDYVFAKDYNLMSIDKLEKFVKKNKHLPNVPSAEEVYKEGIDLAKMDATLLEKVEELTLYIIQQQKEINELKKIISTK